MQRRKFVEFLKLTGFLGCLVLVAALFARINSQEFVGHARVLDGDSLLVSGVEIRLLGIDAPEYNQECKIQGQAEKFLCGRESASFLKRMIGGDAVHCRGNEIDKYDRLLADCTVNDLEINREMVKTGWAVSFGFYESEQETARIGKIGLWQGDFELPKDWRRAENEKHSRSWLGWISF